MNLRKYFQLVLAVMLFIAAVSFGNEAVAASVSFNFGSYTLNDGKVGGTAVIVTVTDSTADVDPAAIDTINVQVTSDSDPSGIALLLVETGVNTGVFENTNLIFTTGTALYEITDTVTVSVASSSDNVSSTSIDSITVTAKSSSDTTGLSLVLNETGINTGVFEGKLSFTSGASSGNTLHVAGGDIVSVTFGTETANSLIVPNPDSSVGAISATVGDTITASYSGMSGTATIVSSGGGPGGGGGGIVRPGLVLDALAFFGGGCRTDCTPPTLGMTSEGIRLVSDGFSYNGNSTDVQLYYTPYPLIQVDIGKNNTAVLKIYENGGVDNIRHVELGFGLGQGEVISQSKAVINYDVFFDGAVSIDVFDPEDALDDVSVSASPAFCTVQSIEKDCLEVTIYHTFRDHLDFNMVGTNVWDSKRNSWQNYYNHGIKIVGESLNPPKTLDVFDRVGYKHTITLIDKKHGMDEAGSLWHYVDGFWKKEHVPVLRDDPITSHGIDRNNSKFFQYLYEQEEIVRDVFARIVQHKTIDNPDYGKNYYPQIKPDPISRSENEKLQQDILKEIKRAEHFLNSSR